MLEYRSPRTVKIEDALNVKHALERLRRASKNDKQAPLLEIVLLAGHVLGKHPLQLLERCFTTAYIELNLRAQGFRSRLSSSPTLEHVPTA